MSQPLEVFVRIRISGVRSGVEVDLDALGIDYASKGPLASDFEMLRGVCDLTAKEAEGAAGVTLDVKVLCGERVWAREAFRGLPTEQPVRRESGFSPCHETTGRTR